MRPRRISDRIMHAFGDYFSSRGKSINELCTLGHRVNFYLPAGNRLSAIVEPRTQWRMYRVGREKFANVAIATINRAGWPINGKSKSIRENRNSERCRQERQFRRFRACHLSSSALVAKKEGIIKLN